MQDSSLKVKAESSSLGIVCTNVHSPGHPSTYSALKTPTGEPFQSVPEGFDGPFEGGAVNFAQPNPASSWAKHFGRFVVAYRQGGRAISATVTGDVAWLKEKRSLHELQEALYETYPQLPQVWLDEVADFISSKILEDDLRIR